MNVAIKTAATRTILSHHTLFSGPRLSDEFMPHLTSELALGFTPDSLWLLELLPTLMSFLAERELLTSDKEAEAVRKFVEMALGSLDSKTKATAIRAIPATIRMCSNRGIEFGFHEVFVQPLFIVDTQFVLAESLAAVFDSVCSWVDACR